MSFFTDLVLRRRRTESFIAIDIGPDSIAGGYALYREDLPPSVLYTIRVPVEYHGKEAPEQAVLRALETLGNTLIREGAPVLARTTGSGRADTVLVSIDAPWQKIAVRTEHFDPGERFIFNKKLVNALLEETSMPVPGKLLVDEGIIGTILNGYETKDPYGKTAHRAAVVVMTSLIDEQFVKNVVALLRGLYHTKHVLPIAGSSLRYQALRSVFPHERDALMVDATCPVTSIALVRKGLFVEILEVPGTSTYDSWGEEIANQLSELAKRYPLPRTIFLLARPEQAAVLQKKLDAAQLGDLWLSDNPPAIIPVLIKHLTGVVRQVAATPPDFQILLMALYHARRLSGGTF